MRGGHSDDLLDIGCLRDRKRRRRRRLAQLLEAEVVVRAFFAENGRPQDLIASLDASRDQAVATQQELDAMAQSWLEGDAPFPERVAVGALAMRFVADFHHLIEEWTVWAADQVRTWQEPDGRNWEDDAHAVFASIVETAKSAPSAAPIRDG